MMKNRIGAVAMGAMMIVSGQALAEKAHDHHHGHSHDQAHADDQKTVHAGYFKDAQVADRALSDWAGDWQSVYPLLTSGALDPVMAHKAEHGDKTAAEYRAYYQIGYKTDIDRIQIDGDEVSFHGKDGILHGHYVSDGHQILTYEKGNRGVRFIFKKTAGDTAAPAFIQFSDHDIAPVKAAHYHLYWGNDRAALLQEVTNWPTYYPAALSPTQVADEMQAH